MTQTNRKVAADDNREINSILGRIVSTAMAIGEVFKDGANAADPEIVLHVKELLQSVAANILQYDTLTKHLSPRSLERISKPIVSQLKRGRVMKVIMKSSNTTSIKNAQEEIDQCLQVLSVCH